MNKHKTKILKGLAILFVFLYHVHYDVLGGTFAIERGEGLQTWVNSISQSLFKSPTEFLLFPAYFGFIGVNVFFVLSGYALTRKYNAEGNVSLKIMLQQTLKVLKPYWVAHPIIHILTWILALLIFKLGYINYYVKFGFHDIGQYIESLLVFTRWFDHDLALNFVGTWWFVGVIIQFYLLYPILFKLIKKFGPQKFFLIAILIGCIYRFIIAEYTNSSPIGISGARMLLMINFPARLPDFAFGMFLSGHKNLTKSNPYIKYSLFALVLGIISHTYIPLMAVSDLLIAIGAFGFVFMISERFNNQFERIFNWLGKQSYLIYLYHEPTIKFFLKILFPLRVHF